MRNLRTASAFEIFLLFIYSLHSYFFLLPSIEGMSYICCAGSPKADRRVFLSSASTETPEPRSFTLNTGTVSVNSRKPCHPATQHLEST